LLAACETAARALARVAMLLLAAMMLVTVADVALRAAINLPVRGVVDLVELFLVGAIFLAVPETFLREEHVVVDVVDYVAGPRAIALLKAFGAVLATGFLMLLMSRIVTPAWEAWSFGDITLDLSIPKWVHWLAILAGTADSIVMMGAVLLRSAAHVARSWRGA